MKTIQSGGLKSFEIPSPIPNMKTTNNRTNGVPERKKYILKKLFKNKKLFFYKLPGNLI